MDIHIDIPPKVKYKFALYILACQEFKGRIAEIEKIALRNRGNLSYYIKGYNKALTDFLSGAPDADSMSEAINYFCDHLKPSINDFRKRNEAIACIFDEIRDYLQKLALFNDDDIRALFTELDFFGRSHAISFYANSPWQVTRHNIDHCCCQNINIFFETTNKSSLISFRFKYTNLDGEIFQNTILVKFNFYWGVAEFDIFPFLFTHEYISHVFTLDQTRNPGFNDGWLMYCLEKYFLNKLTDITREGKIKTGDIYIFHEKIINTFQGNPTKSEVRNSYFAAETLFNFLNSQGLIEKFYLYTFELAAYETPDDWPTKFIDALFLQYNENSNELLERISAESSARNLWNNYLIQIFEPTLY